MLLMDIVFKNDLTHHHPRNIDTKSKRILSTNPPPRLMTPPKLLVDFDSPPCNLSVRLATFTLDKIITNHQ